jgi:terminase large subunit-like protein
MSNLRELAYRLDPALWVHEVLGVEPTKWQEDFLRAPRGASILALTARQCGKTTTAAWAMAHTALFVELTNGSRVLALPGSDDSIRGLTVDGWIVANEAARLRNDLIIAALRPMRARRPDARFAMLSTAWSRTDPFWTAWASDDPSWIRLKATADTDAVHYPPEFLEKERRALGEHEFKREYLGIPLGGQASPFTWELYERATQVSAPLVPPGPAFGPPVQERAVPVPNPFQRLNPSWQLASARAFPFPVAV